MSPLFLASHILQAFPDSEGIVRCVRTLPQCSEDILDALYTHDMPMLERLAPTFQQCSAAFHTPDDLIFWQCAGSGRSLFLFFLSGAFGKTIYDLLTMDITRPPNSAYDITFNITNRITPADILTVLRVLTIVHTWDSTVIQSSITKLRWALDEMIHAARQNHDHLLLSAEEIAQSAPQKDAQLAAIRQQFEDLFLG